MTSPVTLRRASLALLLPVLLQGCGTQAPRGDTDRKGQPMLAAAPLHVTASIKELMDSTIDPAADGLWDSVGTIVTTAGIDTHQPRTDEEWHAVRRHALTLIEAMNLVVMDGRHAAPRGTKAGLGELSPQQMDAKIAANRAEFNLFAQAVHDEGLKALAAIDRKDPEALSSIGSDLDERCEACHVTFWYPNSARPTA
ncbi:hypothetical protein Q4610_10910 [Sphingobium sp. HBC34]|uniref:Cytochrome C n=1 Tax=Sphingobium cyanobacteriorum TaxID=3063954 RepID=A0ABT8ZMZ3_9SPHN|nr:hypothetical protein [Sphingobium sp. HBC34]MDO7835552.1 hypothetical protein [Sphingobium sp. HBC34]